MRFVYEFHGGRYDGRRMTRHETIKVGNAEFTDNMIYERLEGMSAHREELDDQPLVSGYLSPMWGGMMYLVDGEEKSEFDVPEEDRKSHLCFGIIRYEAQEYYEEMCRYGG